MQNWFLSIYQKFNEIIEEKLLKINNIYSITQLHLHLINYILENFSQKS